MAGVVERTFAWISRLAEGAGLDTTLLDRQDGPETPGRWAVVRFVVFLTATVCFAEIFIRLAPTVWAWVPGSGTTGAVARQIVALLLVGLVLFLPLMWLFAKLRAVVEKRVPAGGTALPIKRLFYVFLLLLICQSLFAEAIIVLAGSVGLGGVGLIVALLAAACLLLPVTVALAADTMIAFRGQVDTRLQEVPPKRSDEKLKVVEPRTRPDALPAEVIIAALSKPQPSGKALDYDGRTRGLEGIDKTGYPGFAARVGVFDNPCKRFKDKPAQEEWKNDVDRFNWRQVALAYGEHVRNGMKAKDLPRLVMLCSKETAANDIPYRFRCFFNWLVTPFGEGAGNRLDLRTEPHYDFEDFKPTRDKLKEVRNQLIAKGVAREKIVIDVTGGQRPWLLAALDVTLDEEKDHFSYVTQSKKDGRWVRYYTLCAETTETQDAVASQIGG